MWAPADLNNFHDRATFVRISGAGLRESHTHDVSDHPGKPELSWRDVMMRLWPGWLLCDHAAAQATGRTSASEAYVSLHASYDLLFPPLLTASLAFCGFAALFRPSRPGQSPRLAAVGFGLVLVLAFTYLACDLTENAVADAMFGPEALASEFNQDSVFVLRVLTTGKYVTVSLAFALIIALWTWRWMAARRGEPTASGG
jgi:hypothetical protein